MTTMATDAVGKMLFTAGDEFAFFDLIFPKNVEVFHLGADALIKSWNISTGQCMKVMQIYKILYKLQSRNVVCEIPIPKWALTYFRMNAVLNNW